MAISKINEPQAVSPTRIMVVEDEAITALDIRSKLEYMGYEVPAFTAYGEEAMLQAEKVQPDLVLMDIHLGGEVDGVEAACHITRRLDIPVVYLTAYSDERTLERARQAEPLGYLFKPFSEHELHTTIERALCKHRTETDQER